MENIEINRHPVYSDYGADLDGNIYSFKYGKIKQITHSRHGRGYRQFGLSLRGEYKMYLVHRFVYECWTGKMIDPDLQCNHWDHNKTNNAFANLDLMTNQENKEHREAACRPTGGAAHKKYLQKYGYEMD
jgi:hypothetical protein